jgi:hypothetical protein
MNLEQLASREINTLSWYQSHLFHRQILDQSPSIKTERNQSWQAMASSSSSPAKISLGAPPMETLTRTNYPLWRALVMPDIRGAQLTGFLDGSEEDP